MKGPLISFADDRKKILGLSGACGGLYKYIETHRITSRDEGELIKVDGKVQIFRLRRGAFL